jgi:multiple sugar transport system ATP-binding protein
MNLIPGVARRENGAVAVEAHGSRLPAAGAHRAEEGQQVVYGIRPEHLELSDNDGFPAEVVVVEPTGSETQVFLRFGETDVVAVFRERHSFAPGQQVRLAPRAAFAHLFEPASGAKV